ncbi:hypothetical protein [Thermomonas alba]|uniref:hypothetical protein n=1 Tax=Thermomonas alba TaxID=2888525 RepID=UPI001F04DE10|nr:hypothetical protein [Thermomonas alba]
MLLRAAIVMLVMLNLGAAGWWAFAPAPPVDAPVREGPGLRLLTEATPSAAGATSALPAPATPSTTAAATAAPPAVASPAAASCLRFGPFADTTARDAAQVALAALGASVRVVPAAAGKARGWKVFLPPQPSREQAQALAERLQASGVRDLFVLTAGEDANGIALGRFSSEAGARRRVEELAGKGVQAQMAPVEPAAGVGWLDARIPAGVEPARVAAIAPAKACPAAR